MEKLAPQLLHVLQKRPHVQIAKLVDTRQLWALLMLLDATSVLLARGLILLVRAAVVKTAPLTPPTVNPSKRPHVRPALKAITPKEILVPRHVRRAQLVENRRGPLGHDLAQNAKMVISAVRE
jgi:hypothetical protein